MSALDFLTEPPVECPDINDEDATFVRATNMIRGRDAVEEYLACGMYLLSGNFSFGEIHNGMTPVSKLSFPL
jgi:hypothetical protein